MGSEGAMDQAGTSVSLLESQDNGTWDAEPLVRELRPAPMPWVAARSLANLPHLAFFDSSLRHPDLGRYSYVTADPVEWIQARGHQVEGTGLASSVSGDPFSVLGHRLKHFRTRTIFGLPPFQGGVAGLFGYDLCHHLECLPRPHFDEFQTPDLAIGIYDWVVAFDHLARRAWLISTGFPETEDRARRRRADHRLHEALHMLECSTSFDQLIVDKPVKLVNQYPAGSTTSVWSNFTRDMYLEAVRHALEYIAAGDCFQVNLAQRLACRAGLPPFEYYRRLRERSPSTFSGYLDAGEFAIASTSPERFVSVMRRNVETRPIKGTRPRGPTPAMDEANVRELQTSAKDRAENVMIVDLLRNDLGRVCRYGSVEVTDVCKVETYPFVHHLVSAVRGELCEGLGPVDLLRAVFPGGSVTGAPKIRAMEIIAELEPHTRGPYCGSLGYISFDGNMDSNILIRTCTIGRGWIQFPVGAGIVADSVPEREYEETWDKAEGLLRALDSNTE